MSEVPEIRICNLRRAIAVVYYIDEYTEEKRTLLMREVPETRMCNLRRAIAVVYYI